jgi:hypothetical protein
MLGITGLGDFTLSALPPALPLVSDTLHNLGLMLLVALVALPALTLLSSVWRELRTDRRDRDAGGIRKPSPVRLCTTSGLS